MAPGEETARMFNALSIRKKFFGFGGLMAAVALIIGAIGYWGITRQGTELDGVVVTSLALRNHLESDMMHDALRADVLGALRAARDNNQEDLASVKVDLADHSQNFRERVAANKNLPLSDDVRAAISEVEPKLDSYISMAESMIALAEKDSPAAEAAYPPFLANFE
jgi:methyl-accepting chemotaxis protein